MLFSNALNELGIRFTWIGFLICVLFIFFNTSIVFCQNQKNNVEIQTNSFSSACTSKNIMDQNLANNPLIRAKMREVNAKILSQTRAMKKDAANVNSRSGRNATFVIPTVIHIINGTDGVDLVTDQDIETSMEHLNNEFRNMVNDTLSIDPLFIPYNADTKIEFKLAKLDPQGNCTNGITRSYSDLTYAATDNVKTIIQWNPGSYFNIWIVESIAIPSPLGITISTGLIPGTGAWSDYGAMIRSDVFIIDFVTTDDALIHSTGHCLGLYDTFEGGCGGACDTTGDRICDTPAESQPEFNCFGLNTCDDTGTGLDAGLGTDPPNQTYNFMSFCAYTHMFTLEQRDRMHATIAIHDSLTKLVSPANLLLTGVDSSYVVPVCADFSVDRSLVCEGENIVFMNETFNAVSTSWTWDFGDGNGSTMENPTHVYSTPGFYTVTLTSGNASSSNSVSKNNLIEVLASTGGLLAPVMESFEDDNFPFDSTLRKQWIMKDDGGSSVNRMESAGYTGGASLALDLNSTTDGEVYSIITPTIDFTSADCNEFTFRTAYAQNSASNKDRLSVYGSRNCLENESLLFVSEGASLSNVNMISSTPYIPSDTSEWVQHTVPAIFFSGQDNVRIRFEITTDGGNYFYLDDVNVGCASCEGVLSPVLEQNGLAFQTMETYSSYQWYEDGSLVNGATNQLFPITNNGNYSVQVTDGNGCSGTSNIYQMLNYSILESSSNLVSIYPNPSRGMVNVDFQNKTSHVIEVFNATGQIIKRLENRSDNIQIPLPRGTYIFKVVSGEGIDMHKVVVY